MKITTRPFGGHRFWGRTITVIPTNKSWDDPPSSLEVPWPFTARWFNSWWSRQFTTPFLKGQHFPHPKKVTKNGQGAHVFVKQHVFPQDVGGWVYMRFVPTVFWFCSEIATELHQAKLGTYMPKKPLFAKILWVSNVKKLLGYSNLSHDVRPECLYTKICTHLSTQKKSYKNPSMYIYITVQKSNYICTFIHIQVRIHKYTFTPIKRKKPLQYTYILPKSPSVIYLMCYRHLHIGHIYIYICAIPLCVWHLWSPRMRPIISKAIFGWKFPAKAMFT